MSKCSADETPVCCCMDVGTIVDNTDCIASYSHVFANRAEAEQTLAALSEKAGNDSNLLIVFYVQIMPDDFVMQLHRF
ncbi:Protein of uncharacterised function (DUF406) [Klebsiella pneumoniae]|nr:Protein of uncharacterised function (DUF406) [Klebsiella pneumoniae]